MTWKKRVPVTCSEKPAAFWWKFRDRCLICTSSSRGGISLWTHKLPYKKLWKMAIYSWFTYETWWFSSSLCKVISCHIYNFKAIRWLDRFDSCQCRWKHMNTYAIFVMLFQTMALSENLVPKKISWCIPKFQTHPTIIVFPGRVCVLCYPQFSLWNLFCLQFMWLNTFKYLCKYSITYPYHNRIPPLFCWLYPK